MVLLRCSLCVVLAGVSLTAGPSPSTPVSRCVSELQMKYGTNPAFKITCRSSADCEFEPSQPMNASAMALIDVMAKTVTECWQKAGRSWMISGRVEIACPCCRGRMILIEVFARGSLPRYRPPSAAVIWIDTS